MTRDEFNQMLEDNGIVFVGEAAWRVAQLVAAAEREDIIDIVAMHGGSVEIEAAIRARGEQ